MNNLASWVMTATVACVLGMSLVFACGPAMPVTVVNALDITAIELQCVQVAATKQASIDCRNAVRSAWAAANHIDAGTLVGGSNAADN